MVIVHFEYFSFSLFYFFILPVPVSWINNFVRENLCACLKGKFVYLHTSFFCCWKRPKYDTLNKFFSIVWASNRFPELTWVHQVCIKIQRRERKKNLIECVNMWVRQTKDLSACIQHERHTSVVIMGSVILRASHLCMLIIPTSLSTDDVVIVIALYMCSERITRSRT